MLAILIDTVLVPAIPAAVVAGWVPRASGGAVHRASLLFALALASGIVTSYQRVYGWPVIPPVAAQHWIPIAVPAAALLLGGIDWTVRRGTRQEAGSRGGALLLPALPLIVVASGCSLVAMFGYSAALSQLGAGVAASLGGCLAVHLVRRNLRMGLAPTGVVTVALGILLLIEYRFTEAPPSSVLLLLVGLLAAIAIPSSLGAASARRKPVPALPRVVLGLVATALPVAIAVGISYLGYEPPLY
jgi:hypothetical protein